MIIQKETDLQNNTHGFSVSEEALSIICEVFHVYSNEIADIKPLNAGMTNRSFLFRCNGQSYIFRNPGQGTGKLINRSNEYSVYQQIVNWNICDNLIYFDVEKGYKITQFIENSHNCNPDDVEDVTRCINYLRAFHRLQLSVNHYFDVFQTIQYYESLLGAPSRYRDYEKTKNNVFSLKEYVDATEKDLCLSHIDAVPDNFIMTDERVYLIDWEYAAMQDPHIDIAMFAIYAMYDRRQIDRLIDIYFNGDCPVNVRLKIYCYISMCGLLWSNWCEYKAGVGEDYGEYALKQYQYAKDYYQIFMEESHHA